VAKKKDAFYFSHDANARHDEKILELRAELGWEGYGLYWAIVECLRETTEYKYNIKKLNGLALHLSTTCETLENIISNFDLFEYNEDYFWSSSLQKRMQDYDFLKNKAIESGRKGAEIKRNKSNPEATLKQPLSNPEATLKQPLSNLEAIKLNKIKLNKKKEEKNIEEYSLVFDEFRKMYPGTKLGLEVEFKNFQRHKDWEVILPDLSKKLESQILYKHFEARTKGWTADWKNLKTWINNRCWEEEIAKASPHAPPNKGISFFATGE
jgi:hypothetical protein